MGHEAFRTREVPGFITWIASRRSGTRGRRSFIRLNLFPDNHGDIEFGNGLSIDEITIHGNQNVEIPLCQTE
uniref:Uncharacterized protein n=1 Tax=Candidatus Kentrum sp. TC TaxID=2126339 RepID=A0A451ACC6_9GAMM|nr:MAG: hypothetical protein BECKTC1821F_GA0114240_11035 [Candidatus Kentron sp. TC]